MKHLIAVGAIFALSGCASIFSGTTQDITLRTTPGATYTITDTYGRRVASGQGEGTASLVRGASYFSPHAYTARITKPGYHPRTIEITPGINPWYFANLLIGGVVGMVIVDPLTGAMYKFLPSDIDAPLDQISPDNAEALSGQPIAQRQAAAKAVSRYEYAATQRAQAKGCKPLAAPNTDGTKDPHETLTFECKGGSTITVACSINGCT